MLREVSSLFFSRSTPKGLQEKETNVEVSKSCPVGPHDLIRNGSIITNDRPFTSNLDNPENSFFYRDIYEKGLEARGFISPDAKEITLNPAGLRLIGFVDQDSKTAMRAKRFFGLSDLFSRRVENLIRTEVIPEVLRKGSWLGETSIRNIQGKEVPVSLHWMAHRTAEGTLLGFSVGIGVLTLYQRNEANVDIKSILKAIPDIVIVMDLFGNYLDCQSPEHPELFLAPKDFIGRDVRDIWPQDIASKALDCARTAIKTGRVDGYEYPVRLSAGIEWYEARFSRRDENSVMIVCRNITSKKLAEQQLKQSSGLFRQYFQLGLVGMAVTSVDKRFIEVNPELLAILGYNEEELKQRTWMELTHADDLEKDIRLFNQALSGEIPGYTIEKRFRRKNGTFADTIVSVAGSRKPDGTVEHFFKLVQDISEKKARDHAAERHRVRLETLYELYCDSSCSDEQNVVEALRLGCSWFGMERAGIVMEDEKVGNSLEYSYPSFDWKDTDSLGTLVDFNLSRGTLPQDETLFCFDTASSPDPGLLRLSRFGIGALVAARLIVRGKDCGALFLASSRPFHQEADRAHAVDLKLLSRWVASKLERIRDVKQLIEARRTAEELSEMKSRFLANISHEIRTPASGLLGLTDLLLDTEMQPNQREFTNGIQLSARALLSVINDILDFSKLESGTMLCHIQDCELRPAIQGVLDILGPLARNKGIRLELEVDSNLPKMVRADPVRLRQVLINLGDNAIKFTNQGVVKYRVKLVQPEESGPFIRFEVEDTGVGISKENHQAIFEPFVQADDSSSRKHGGTGLGLAICRKFVEMMQGQIGVRSQRGVGSVFWVTLPMNLDERKQESDCQSDPRKPNLIDDWSSEPLAPIPPLKILLAEDNYINQMVVSIMLEKMGHTVKSVENGSLALQELATNRYDLVLMDCQMPELDGYRATQRQRIREKKNQARRVAIIAMTAHAMKGDREKCLNAGMDGYLSKPVDGVSLVSEIRRVLKLGTDSKPNHIQ